MNINLNQPVTDIDHETIVGPAIDAVVAALYKIPPASGDGGEAYKQYKLADLIESKGGKVELRDEEIAQIKYAVSRLHPPIILGQIFAMLEGAEDK